MNKYFFLTVVFLFSGMAAAGPRVVGNGGISVVGRNPQTQEITEAYLLDLFEAEYLGQPVSRKNSPVDEQIQQALDLLKEAGGVAYELNRQIKEIQSNTFYLDPRVGMPLTDDALPTFNKKGCNFEQVALYDDETEQLRIDSEIYNSPNFSRTDAAALWFHEAIYKLDRFFISAKDSRESRKLTAMLFMTNTPVDIAEAFNNRFPKYRLASDDKVLWVDGSQVIQVDLTMENAPDGISCHLNAFSTGGGEFSVDRKKTFYEKVISMGKGRTGKLNLWLNGERGGHLVECRSKVANPDIKKMKATATFNQAGRQIFKVDFPPFQFYDFDHFYFKSDQSEKDPKPWVLRFL